jgi:copper transport protein
VLAAALAYVGAPRAQAHAGLVISDPVAGATLGASPTVVRMTFSERPDAPLSSIVVIDNRGVAYQVGRPSATPGNPLILTEPVQHLVRGVYTVNWRVVSAIDGHATTGAFDFGVQVSPSRSAAISRGTSTAVSSPLELVARWILILGLIGLVGGATAGVVGFGGRVGAIVLASGGWVVAVVGLVVLGLAQRSNAGTSLGRLLSSPVGHALIWRAVAIVCAGVALLIAWRVPRARRVMLLLVDIAAVVAIVVHVANGHAAASSWPSSLSVGLQAVHFAVAGMWIGGLAALLIGLRGQPSPAKSDAIRRFGFVAVTGLVVVAATGIARAFGELRSWSELLTTGYGRAVVAKLLLVAIIAALGYRNRTWAVPASSADLRPLRRTSSVELVFAVAALGVAGLLGTLAPPVTAGTSLLPGLSASGADFATSVRVELTALSNEPGPNQFTVRATDYDTGASVRGTNVQLRFTPLDDPSVASTTLALSPARGGTYQGSGANLAFDGRWGVTVLVQRENSAVEVPLELDPAAQPQQLSIERIPGQAPKYTTELPGLDEVRISPNPERAGPSRVIVTFFQLPFDGQDFIDQLVVTAAKGNGPVQQQSFRRVETGKFVSPIDLAAGANQIAVTGHRRDGTRLRSVFDLQVPAR